MAQPSICQYFTSKKRPALEDTNPTKKVLKLDEAPQLTVNNNRSAVLENGVKNRLSRLQEKILEYQTKQNEEVILTTPKQKKVDDLAAVKKALSKSKKLQALKNSLNKFQKLDNQLKAVDAEVQQKKAAPKLDSFKAIEYEVPLSPHKAQSPEKPYLSPRKNLSNIRNVQGSPIKRTLFQPETRESCPESPVKSGLLLPFKYKSLAEMFNAIEGITQIMYNRKETITFKKLKSAVEEITKRTFVQKYLAQIKYVYPDAFNYSQEKVTNFGFNSAQNQYDLVVVPKIEGDTMTTKIILDRRRTLHQLLIKRVKVFHDEFLSSLVPPLVIKDNLTRWHPEFDLEKVPDVELGELPESPSLGKCLTAKETLESARLIFKCNTRMEQALSNLQLIKNKVPVEDKADEPQPQTLLKGIPKSLLEKVRQKQAAKALMSMTITAQDEKMSLIYARLPELARIAWNLFVTEKKSVMELDVVVEKVGHSYPGSLKKDEIVTHLEVIAKEVPKWLVFHKLRNSVFIKLTKHTDLSSVLAKLDELAKEKKVY